MAYTDYSISNNMYGYDDEERKRREQEQLQQTYGATTTAPVAPVNPQSMVDYSLASTNPNQPVESGLGLQLPEQVQQQNISMGQPPVPQPLQQPPAMPTAQTMGQEQEPYMANPVTPYLNMYQSAQEDPGALLKLNQDDTAPEWIRKRAREQSYNVLHNEYNFNKAQEQMKSMSPDDLQSHLKERTNDGSYIKMIAFAMLGMDKSAADQAAKLKIGTDQAVMGSDGKPYLIKVAANGTPIDGYNATTGEKLNANDLVAVTAGATTTKGATTHTGKMQDVTTGEIYYERTTPQGIQLVDTNGKKYTGSTANLRAYGIGSDIATKNQIQLQELQNKLAYAGPTASAEVRERIIGENEAKFGPLSEQYKAQVRGVQPQVQGTVPVQGQQAVTQPQPQPQPQSQPPVAQTQPPVAQTQPPVAQTQPQPKVAAPVKPAPIVTSKGTNVVGGGGTTPAQREANLATQQKQQAANIEQRKELNVAELKPPATQRGTNVATDIKNQRFADETYGLIKPVSDLIKKSTGSGIGAGVDVIAGKFGVGTKGQQAIAELKPMIYPILANVPRFEGPQSDYDVQVYKQAAGDFANETLPVKTRLAALNGLVSLLKKYDKEGKNDWSFGEGKESNTTSSGNKFKRVQ